jgi:hypothetical protein
VKSTLKTLPFHGAEVTGKNAASQKKFHLVFLGGTLSPVSALAANAGVLKAGPWWANGGKMTLEPVAEKPESQDLMGRTNTIQKPEARLGREVQARIGQQLRAMYNDVVNQGVPDHLADLVRRLSDEEPE